MARIQHGGSVALKARALPFHTFPARVDRIAPAATKDPQAKDGQGKDGQSTVTVYCRLENPGGDLRPGMTGCAHVYTGDRPLGEIAVDRILRVVRTEFWW